MEASNRTLNTQLSAHSLRFIKFCIVGLINSLVDLGLFYILTLPFLSLPVITANSISFTTAVLCSYLLNRNFTFRDKNHTTSFTNGLFKYLVVGITGLLLSNLIIYLIIDDFGPLLAKIISIGIVVFWNYLATHYLVFSSTTQNISYHDH